MSLRWKLSSLLPLLLASASVGLGCDPGASSSPEEAPPEATESSEHDPLRAKMTRLAERVEQTRQELEIPGLALVVVKDGEVLLQQGFGLRDRDKDLPVNEDTLFAIGSTTKAFTALLAVMAEEEGKLSLDAHPRTCLEYFKLKDPEADAGITIRDLLTHSSGLMRTDLGWYTGALNTREIIELAGLAEPTAELRESFQYQNVMYAAAGECLASVYEMPYPELVKRRIFEPLGMTHGTGLDAKSALASDNRAIGYTEAGPDEALYPVPMRPIDQVAAAGSINASVRDIAAWLGMLTQGGSYGDGQQLVSSKGFREIGKKHQRIGPGVHYGLGWMRDRWRGHLRLAHGGSIDGYVAQISFLPKEGIGYALFTNIQNGDIQGSVAEEVFASLLDENWGAKKEQGEQGEQELPEGAEAEVGAYGYLGGPEMEIRVEETTKGRILQLVVPRQPRFELIPMGEAEERRYRLGAPAPDGIYVQFRQRADAPRRQEFALEQPQGTVVLPRISDRDREAAQKKEARPEDLEILGLYATKPDEDLQEQGELEVALVFGRPALRNPSGEDTPLLAREDGHYQLAAAPEDYQVHRVIADAALVEKEKKAGRKIKEGQLWGLEIRVPGEDPERLRLKAEVKRPTITPRALLAKVQRAHNSRALAKHRSSRRVSTAKWINQGIETRRTMLRTSENWLRDEQVLRAFDRDLGTLYSLYDGSTVRDGADFTTELPLNDANIANVKLAARWDHWSNTEEPGLGEFEILRFGEVEGQEVIVAKRALARGGHLIESYSTKSYLLLERITVVPVNQEGAQVGITETFDDYKKVQGIPVAHTVRSKTPQGEVEETVLEYVFDEDIPIERFQEP